MKLITAMRLRAMSNTEKEKRFDALNQKLGITHLSELTEYGQEMEERDWLKKKLGYAKQ
jgi:hypothetical protein